MATVSVGAGALEYTLDEAAPGAEGKAPLVLLHEGLGSIGLWRDFPAMLRTATGDRRMLVYSRHGYGWSAPRTGPVSFQHEATSVLPELLRSLEVERPILVGHSDGATIALVHAAGGHPTAALVLFAPHVFVEACTLDGIRRARHDYKSAALRARLANHHADVEATFFGWSDLWLDPDFGAWNIVGSLAAVTCPVLVVQGVLDEYGTLAQLDAIEQHSAGAVQRVELDGVGHAPHAEAPEAVCAAVRAFLRAAGL
jgi:pimeloyl-ACP methyl ester carboxylesterase